MTKLHRAEELHRLALDVLQAAGWSEDDARACADHLVLANLSGHDSHGIGMLPAYIKSWQDGHLKPTNQPEVTGDSAPFLTIHAHVALGQPAAKFATERAIAMAKTSGACVLNLVNAHHIGRVGHYAEMAAAAGMIGMFWVNVAGRPPIVAPFGGKSPVFGTNPHAIGIPNGDEPLILDFATSRMAHGKARVAYNKGEQVPLGYLIDHEGHPTTDPAVVQRENKDTGALLPFGDHKGAGVSLVAEILSAALVSAAATIHRSERKSWIINSMFGLVFDPDRIGNAAMRAEKIASLAAYQRSIPAADGFDMVRSPGDKEREVRAERSRTGIAIDPETWRQLMEAKAAAGAKAD